MICSMSCTLQRTRNVRIKDTYPDPSTTASVTDVRSGTSRNSARFAFLPQLLL